MTAERSRPRVLVVGAYERDNFGDLLFLLVTEEYLHNPGDVHGQQGAKVVAAAPFSSDMSALLDHHVPAYGPLLRDETYDVIWTVGGQVGGTDLRSAYRMSATPGDYHRFQQSSEPERAEILRQAVGDAPIVSPYIPSPIAYPRNAGAITVLNSVGVAGIRSAGRYRREELVALLRGQTFISVRDKESSDYLAALGIEHRLVPDAVHAISVLWPAGPSGPTARGEVVLPLSTGSDVAVFQAGSSILRRLGHQNVAVRLAHSSHLKGLKLRLLMAGTATGHDSAEDYDKLIAYVRQIAPGTDIATITDRRPLDLVDHLRTARVVIGTSLHVRIVASAYAVPRVTLQRTKPTRYARVWDPGMPYDVALGDLDNAIGAALDKAADPVELERSAELSRLAHENLADLAGQVLTQARTDSVEDKAIRLKLRNRNQAELLAVRAVREAEVAALELDLKAARSELAAIRSSRAYRVAARGARAARALQRSFALWRPASSPSSRRGRSA